MIALLMPTDFLHQSHSRLKGIGEIFLRGSRSQNWHELGRGKSFEREIHRWSLLRCGRGYCGKYMAAFFVMKLLLMGRGSVGRSVNITFLCVGVYGSGQ